VGNARWSDADWQAHATKARRKSRSEIFTQSSLAPELDPGRIPVRESCDSPANPDSTPIILGVDETGSMGVLAEVIIKQGLGTIMKAIYDRRPVTDPHILCMALGDAFTDAAPLQVTQFEASVEPLTNQVRKLYLEGNGGGNGGESYALAWLFAATKTKCDAFRRGRKGFLFTIGDEAPHPTITREQAQRVAGVSAEKDLSARSLLDSLKDDWHVFHLIVETSATREQDAVKKWRELLGERAILVSDIDRLAEVIVSLVQAVAGTSPEEIVESWDEASAPAVRGLFDQLVGWLRNRPAAEASR
jgi:hypothetical protein